MAPIHPNTRRQLRVLHREFLFRIVDRELLSSHARGDMSKLLLQFISLLIFVGMIFAAPAVLLQPNPDPQARLVLAWSTVHALIATTMLVVGLFGVLSWNSMFPDRIDVNVLAPLPVRARTVFFAKIASVVTALGVTVLALHLAAGSVWPMWLNTWTPGDGGVLGFARVTLAYWLAMIAAGAFVFGVITSVQGAIAVLLPRRAFLRVSSFLQLAAFAFIVMIYTIQPIRTTPAIITALQQDGPITWLPSFWFFGLFQQVNGGPTAFATLAWRAWWAIGLVAVLSASAYALSYARTLRRIAEEPSIAPGGRFVSRLPAFGRALHTAIVHFSIRTLLRSPQHRVILAFYLGIGGAVGIMLLGMRLVWMRQGAATDALFQRTMALVIFANIILLIFAVLGTRMAFALPIDLRANWIFRITPLPGGRALLAARRRAMIALSAGPVWIASSLFVLWTWPWLPALGHLVISALIGSILVEIALLGTQKIPFTCSYLPGRSNVHVTFWLGMLFVLMGTSLFAGVERAALQDPLRYAAIVGSLAAVSIGLRWATGSRVASGTEVVETTFEELEEQPVALNVWDSRFVS